MYIYIIHVRMCMYVCIHCTEVIEELQMMASPVKSTGSLPDDYEMTSLPPIALPTRKYY